MAKKIKQIKNKSILTAIVLLVLLAIMALVVILTNSNKSQIIDSKAWNCAQYVFEVSRAGDVRVRNGSTSSEGAQTADVYINGSKVATLNVPALSVGSGAYLGKVKVPTNGVFSWRVDGSSDCENKGDHPLNCNFTETKIQP